MSREIKFRFYDSKVSKRMIYADPMGRLDNLFVKWENTPKASPLMQYTGLKDKNGREIYEGDIVKGKAYEFANAPRIIGEVIYDYCEFKINSVREKTNRMKVELNTVYEVIGNIHEHPHLLEQE